MKFGICGTPDNASKVKESGYDYIELALNQMSCLSDTDFNCVVEILKAAGIKSLAMNGFFPYDLKIVGNSVNKIEIEKYIEKALSRASRLGAETVVFGSGKSRAVPEGESREKCISQLYDCIYRTGMIAKNYGINIVIEPLNSSETNVINTVTDGAQVVDCISLDNVKTMVDFFHYTQMDEPDNDLVTACSHIGHVHIARGTSDRGVPNASDTDYLKHIGELLKSINYNSSVSVEAVYTDFNREAEEIINLMKMYF